jgi:hypothetical protein
MTVQATFLFSTRQRIHHGAVSQHGAALVRDIKQIAMAFQALVILMFAQAFSRFFWWSYSSMTT